MLVYFNGRPEGRWDITESVRQATAARIAAANPTITVVEKIARGLGVAPADLLPKR